MKKWNLTLSDFILYGAVTCIGNIIATFLVELIISYGISPLGYNGFTIVLAWVVLCCCSLVFVWVGVFLLFKQKEEEHYMPTEDNHFWIKKGLLIIMPGELLRFLICLPNIGHLNTVSGQMAIAASTLFGRTYLLWTDRTYAVRQNGAFIFWDYVAYSVCYFIFLVIHIFVVLAMYRYFWNKGKKEHDYFIKK